MYFSDFIASKAVTKTRIGVLAGVPVSRVSQWVNGERLMTPEKAFEVGEALRDSCNLETSGAEFLWAGGYWPQILELIKHLATQGDRGLREAVFLFCWLPWRMHSFEIRVVNRRFAQKLGRTEIDLQSELTQARNTRSIIKLAKGADSDHILAEWQPSWQSNLELEAQIQDEMSIDPGGREAERYLLDDLMPRYERTQDEFPELIEGLDEVCRSESVRSSIANALEHYFNGSLDSLSHVLVGSPTIAGRIELEVIDAMIYAADKLNKAMLPTYAAPRIWRMVGAWLYEIAPDLMSEFSKALPDNFVTHPELLARKAHAREIEKLIEDEAEGDVNDA
jgi:hypothetical protein